MERFSNILDGKILGDSSEVISSGFGTSWWGVPGKRIKKRQVWI